MNTRMHQEAFPGEDISDRPPPEASVPGLLALIEGDLPSGRYAAARARGGAGVSAALAFTLPPALEAADAARGARAGARRGAADGRARRPPLDHARFRDLPAHLRPGDLLVVNESATLPGGARHARLADGTRASTLHLSTPDRRAAATRWVVELRRDGARFRGARAGERVALPGGGARASSCAPYLSAGRLWIAALELPAPLLDYLAAHGAPDPLRAPAARAAARRPPDGLRARARQRRDAERRPPVHPAPPARARRARRRRRADPPPHRRQLAGARRAAVPRALRASRAATAARVNATRRAGGRVIAVGTTVTRALETAARAGRHGARRRGLDVAHDHARARRPRRRRPDHRLARARRAATCCCSRRSPAARWSSAPTPPRVALRLPLARVRRRHLLLP